MTTELIKINLYHGPTLYIAEVSPSITVQGLRMKIEEITDVPYLNQKLIFKGKTLTDFSVVLSSAGICSGSKIMVLGRKHNPASDSVYIKITEIEALCSGPEKKLAEVTSEVDGIKNGFLQAKLCIESLSKLTRKLLIINEEMMTMLEELDGFSFEPHQELAKCKRKDVVKRIQKDIDEIDRVQTVICELKKSES